MGDIAPLDDVLTIAGVCARVMVADEARKTYRRLMAGVTEASADWPQTPAARRAILDVYRAEFRAALNLPPMRGE